MMSDRRTNGIGGYLPVSQVIGGLTALIVLVVGFLGSLFVDTLKDHAADLDRLREDNAVQKAELLRLRAKFDSLDGVCIKTGEE